MATNENNLPQPEDIQWQPLCVSEDMMDPTFCNKKFPVPWRSSIAISAYEPKKDELPEPFCAGKLTYLKVTVSITGYQPTDEEIEKGYTEFDNTPVEVGLDEIFETYFGCYGVLANIGIFPNSTKNWETKDYPKIIGMEPKIRELVQNATESGEVLTSSRNDVSTGKSFSRTNSIKTGIAGKHSESVSFGIPSGPEVSSTNEIGSTHEWGSTAEDSRQTSIDESRNRSETQATSTEIEQMYNMLSAYHLGTNRGVFLMLPRPHMLQPTDRRTFIQGVRSIEGIQEFFLVISRPNDMEGICVEARLDTGHFPEDIEIKQPEEKYEEREAEFIIDKHARNGTKNGGGPFNLQGEIVPIDKVFNVPAGFVVDRRTTPPSHPLGDSGHIGISQTDIGSNAQGSPMEYDYYTTDTTAVVEGKIQGAWGAGAGAIFHRKYKVYLRSENPIPSDVEAVADIAGLFITTRSLCCCFYKKEDDDCLTKGRLSPRPVPPIIDSTVTKIIEQRRLKISENLLRNSNTRTRMEPAIKGVLRQLKSIMVSSRENRHSHFEDGITFLESDYFVHSILKYFPERVKERNLQSVRELDEKVKRGYGLEATIGEALNDTLATFIVKTNLGYLDAVKQREILISQVKEAR